MKRMLVLSLVLSALILATGCRQPSPATISVFDTRFKYRGSLVWLYEGPGGEIHLLHGNYRDQTAILVADGGFNLMNNDKLVNNKGEWQELEKVSKNQLVYVSEVKLAAGEEKQVLKEPDYVLSVDLEKLENKLPQIKNAAELEALKEAFSMALQEDRNPLVTITMADGGRMQAELYPEVAPNTVNNFISLVQQGFYNGLIFHRVIPGFMIQGGDPQGTGGGGPGYAIKGEFASNGFKNDLAHEPGVLSMARAQPPDSAGSQFFIMVAAAPHLDGNYAAFGKLISGQEVADQIVASERDAGDRPLQPAKIQSMTVEVFGVTYPAPKTIAR